MPRLCHIERYVERSLLFNLSLRNTVSDVLNNIVVIQDNITPIHPNLRKLKNQLAILYQMICVTETEMLTDVENY
jgi:hypothetical protein